MKHIAEIAVALVWISGIVIAKGFWSTLFSIFIPPWAFYLFIEKVLILYGLA